MNNDIACQAPMNIFLFDWLEEFFVAEKKLDDLIFNFFSFSAAIINKSKQIFCRREKKMSRL